MNSLSNFVQRSYARVNKLIFTFAQRSVKERPLIGNIMPEKSSISTVEERHQQAVELINFLKREMDGLEKYIQEKSFDEGHKKLLAENERLKQEVELWRARVVELEEKRGIKQYPIPMNPFAEKPVSIASKLDVGEPLALSSVETTVSQVQEKSNKKEKTEKKEKKEGAVKKKEKASKAQEPAGGAKDDSQDIHVGRLNLRVGRIVSVDKHPDADSLYVEQIDVGEEKPRTIVSGLVKYVPIEQMQNRLVIVLCNLKPAKMRGILSEGMVMCASTPENVEVLDPPADAHPGEQVTCDDFPGEPDSLLNPKKKIFEQVAPDLKTNNECVATYKSSVLKVGNKGVVKASTLVGVQIK